MVIRTDLVERYTHSRHGFPSVATSIFDTSIIDQRGNGMGKVRESESTFRRGRAVNGMVRGVVIIVAAFAVLGSFTAGLTTILGRTLFAFGGADPRLPLERLPILLQADLREGATGTLADADPLLRVLSGVPLLIEAVTVVLAARLLLVVLGRVSRRDPFGAAALLGWRRLTGTLLIGGVLAGLISTAAFTYLNVALGSWPFGIGAGLDFSSEERNDFLGGDYQGIGIDFPQWPVSLIVAGLVALALTTAFRTGARLERDVDGVI